MHVMRSPMLLITMPLLILATYHAFAYMSKAFAGHPLWQQRGAPVYLWLMTKQVSQSVRTDPVVHSCPSSPRALPGSHGRDCGVLTMWRHMQREAQVYNAAAEIGTGFLLIAQLLTPARSILLTFVYWCVTCAAARSIILSPPDCASTCSGRRSFASCLCTRAAGLNGVCSSV